MAGTKIHIQQRKKRRLEAPKNSRGYTKQELLAYMSPEQFARFERYVGKDSTFGIDSTGELLYLVSQVDSFLTVM